jgi:hypothetical protein
MKTCSLLFVRRDQYVFEISLSQYADEYERMLLRRGEHTAVSAGGESGHRTRDASIGFAEGYVSVVLGLPLNVPPITASYTRFADRILTRRYDRQMSVWWPIVGGIIAPSLAMVGIAVGMLRMSPPAFRAGRSWLWAAALWVMVWSAVVYLTASRTVTGTCMLVAVEIAAVVLLRVGLQWVDSRERLHAPAATKTAEEGGTVTPRLVACDSRSLMIDPTDVSMGPGKPEDRLTAAMLAFEYDPALPTGPRVTVRAKLSFEKQANQYQGGGQTAIVGHGYWRDTTRNWATFSPGVRHELIVAIEHRGRITGIQDERSDRSDLRPTLPELGVWAIPSFYSVTIELILTDETTHQRLAVNTFQYVLHIAEFELYLIKTEG